MLSLFRSEIRNKLIGFVTQRWFLFHCLLLNINARLKKETTSVGNWEVNANLISSFFMLVQLKIFKGFSSYFFIPELIMIYVKNFTGKWWKWTTMKFSYLFIQYTKGGYLMLLCSVFVVICLRVCTFEIIH